MKLSLQWMVIWKNGGKKNETDSKLDCQQESQTSADPEYLWGFPTMCVLKIFYLKIKIHGQLININKFTDFHNGFLTIFSALRSNTRWTTELMNIHICVEDIDNFMGFLTIFYLKNLWTTH